MKKMLFVGDRVNKDSPCCSTLNEDVGDMIFKKSLSTNQ